MTFGLACCAGIVLLSYFALSVLGIDRAGNGRPVLHETCACLQGPAWLPVPDWLPVPACQCSTLMPAALTSN